MAASIGYVFRRNPHVVHRPTDSHSDPVGNKGLSDFKSGLAVIFDCGNFSPVSLALTGASVEDQIFDISLANYNTGDGFSFRQLDQNLVSRTANGF